MAILGIHFSFWGCMDGCRVLKAGVVLALALDFLDILGSDRIATVFLFSR